ncbi:glycosyltransferase family 2 protein [Mariniflexile sp.]|uniref:glycosyltransferase family 2 protein n=1 Tax=Mariniflexile sp. TaxID=1979402 RepID=UPI0040483096
MQASILIVSKNRKDELEKTLLILEKLVDFSIHEILVFLDGCTDNSFVLKEKFNWVKWEISKKSIGASKARNVLYPKALGKFLIGLDDDAHPINKDFILKTIKIFHKYPNVGVIAFQEIKGLLNKEDEINFGKIADEEYFTNEFIGCGFAIRKDVYNVTNGFPKWIDIYGEESCVAIEVLSKGYDILYSNQIKVNHRVNKEARKNIGHNYFRFGKQLKNTTYYYMVYHKFPLVKIIRLYWHNFRKYAVNDWKYFTVYFRTALETVIGLSTILKYRRPIEKRIIKKSRSLQNLKF